MRASRRASNDVLVFVAELTLSTDVLVSVWSSHCCSLSGGTVGIIDLKVVNLSPRSLNWMMLRKQFMSSSSGSCCIALSRKPCSQLNRIFCMFPFLLLNVQRLYFLRVFLLRQASVEGSGLA